MMNGNYKITLAIATHNRKHLLEKMIKSLYMTDIGNNINIRIYDDASTDFDEDYLKKAFPDSKSIIRNPVNVGPSKNMHKIFTDFLAHEDDILILTDSDLIFNREWLSVVERIIDHTDGMMSLYNSVLHTGILNTLQIENVNMLNKRTIGGAGSVFKKDVVRKIVSELPPSNTYDWDWSEYLVKSGVRLLVTERSYVQHIGLVGFNSGNYFGGDRSGSLCDYGINFIGGNEHNEKIQGEFFNELLQIYTKEIERFKKIIISGKLLRTYHALRAAYRLLKSKIALKKNKLMTRLRKFFFYKK
jgi:glycosyltransferase involved in cell wall biosynthesis